MNVNQGEGVSNICKNGLPSFMNDPQRSITHFTKIRSLTLTMSMTSTPASWAMNPRTEKTTNPQKMEVKAKKSKKVKGQRWKTEKGPRSKLKKIENFRTVFCATPFNYIQVWSSIIKTSIFIISIIQSCSSQPEVRVPTRVREKSEGVRQKFQVVNENAVKYPKIILLGVCGFYFSCLGVRWQKKVVNLWFFWLFFAAKMLKINWI